MNNWQHSLSPLIKSVIGGWLAFAAFFTAYILIGSRDPYFALEIGPVGAFVFFGGIFSLFYLLNFLLIVVPYFLIFHMRSSPHPALRGLWGAAMFCLSVPLWIFATNSSPHNIPWCMAFAAVAGAASFMSLRSSIVTSKGN